MASPIAASAFNRLGQYASCPGTVTVTQNSPFLPQQWPRPSTILIAPTHGGIARLSWPGGFGKTPRWYTRERSPIPVLTGPGVERLSQTAKGNRISNHHLQYKLTVYFIIMSVCGKKTLLKIIKTIPNKLAPMAYTCSKSARKAEELNVLILLPCQLRSLATNKNVAYEWHFCCGRTGEYQLVKDLYNPIRQTFVAAQSWTKLTRGPHNDLMRLFQT